MALSSVGEDCVPAVKIDSRCELGQLFESGTIPALESGAHSPARCEDATLSDQWSSAWSIAVRDPSSVASGASVSSGPARTTAETKVESRTLSVRPLASSGSCDGAALGPELASETSRTIEFAAGSDAAAWGAGGAGGVGAGGAGGGVVGSGSSSTTPTQSAVDDSVVVAGGAVVAPAPHARRVRRLASGRTRGAVLGRRRRLYRVGSLRRGGALRRLRCVVRSRLRSGRRRLGLLRSSLGGLGRHRLALRGSCVGRVAAARWRVGRRGRDILWGVAGSVLGGRRSAERERGGEHRHKGR